MAKKTRFTLAFACAAMTALCGASGLAGAQTMMPIDTYGSAPYQATGPHNLGVLRQSDVNGPQGMSPATSPQAAPGNMATSDDVLQPVQSGNVTYVTGGVGDEERAALKAAEKDYNLRVMSASKDGAFVGSTHIVIRDRKGDSLVDADAGPLFFAKLPSGVYTLEATHDGTFKKQSVSVKGGRPALVHLGW